MNLAIWRARKPSHLLSIAVGCVPQQLTYTRFPAGRFSHLGEDALDAR